MGGGKEQKKTNQMLETDRSTQDREHTEDRGAIQAKQTEADTTSAESRKGFEDNLADFKTRDYTLGGSYHSDYNPNFTRKYMENFANTGGVDPATFDRWRGGGVYDEFSKTGGISEGDKTNIRSRGASVIPAYYDAVNRDVDRAALVGGRMGPGGLALKAKLAREGAGASADAVRDTELGLSEAVNKGRMWGTEGMSRTESDLQGALQKGKMFGAEGIRGIESDTNNILSNQSMFNAGQDFGQARYNSGVTSDRDQTALAAEGALYDSDRDYSLGLEGLGLDERNSYYGARNAGIQARIGNNPKRDWFGTIMGGAGPIIAGAAGI